MRDLATKLVGQDKQGSESEDGEAKSTEKSKWKKFWPGKA
jgi:hypothetical protein